MDTFFSKRGITDAVREARPYVRWDDAGDLSNLLGLAPEFAERPGTVRRRMGKAGGYVIVKHPLPGREPIVPQFRADVPYAQDGKYMMWPAPRDTYVHTHPLKKGDTARHVTRLHGGQEPGTSHPHPSSQKDPNVSPEKRLDMHPLSWALLPGADRVFFSIEGSVKADALLSAGECAFAVPSVTMWQAPELERFARDHLTGKQVLVCPDGDWASNPEVILQAVECREALRRWGVDAHVAAAPLEPGHEKDCTRPDCTKGVDDFIGQGGHVDDLLVLERELSPGFRDWAFRHLRDASRSDRGKTDVAVMGWLTLHADETGVVMRPLETMSKYIDRQPYSLSRAVNRLIAEGWLMGLAPGFKYTFKEERFTRVRLPDGKLRRRPLAHGPGFVEPVFLWVTEPDLRATVRNVRLGEVGSRSPA